MLSDNVHQTKSHAEESRGLRSPGDSAHASQAPPESALSQRWGRAPKRGPGVGHLLPGPRVFPEEKSLVNEAARSLWQFKNFMVSFEAFF